MKNFSKGFGIGCGILAAAGIGIVVFIGSCMIVFRPSTEQKQQIDIRFLFQQPKEIHDEWYFGYPKRFMFADREFYNYESYAITYIDDMPFIISIPHPGIYTEEEAKKELNLLGFYPIERAEITGMLFNYYIDGFHIFIPISSKDAKTTNIFFKDTSIIPVDG